MSVEREMRICVIGSGYVGLVAAVCFAEIGHRVICVDNDEAKVSQLNSGHIPIYEEHLPNLFRKHHTRCIKFTSDLRRAVETSDAIFIAVGTPQSSSGAADLSYVEGVANDIAKYITGYKVIVEKSTVPVRTHERITQCILRHGVPRNSFDVASNPEFLREGSAVVDFLHPDRIVVGANSERAADTLKRIYKPLTSGKYYLRGDGLKGPLTYESPAKLLLTSTQSAELIKHASNAFLAMKISFINSVANLAEAVHADIEQVAAGIGLDSRIGSKFLSAGLGYGGSCFPKDVAAFTWVAEQEGIDFSLLEEVRNINIRQQQVFLAKIRSALWTLEGKRIAALGLSFKGGTDDIRESPAIDVIRSLCDAGCKIAVYDPVAGDRAKIALPASRSMEYVANPYEAARGADALVILTDWTEFGRLDLLKVKELLRFPIIIDGRNLYNPQVMVRHGFTYLSIGRPPVYGISKSEAVSEAERDGLSVAMHITNVAVRSTPEIAGQQTYEAV